MNKTLRGYKLFEMDDKGNLFPLFIDKKEAIPMGEWLHAKHIPTKGFAIRSGWHIGDVPDAPWLKGYDGTDVGCYNSQRGKHFHRVWCMVEYNANHDYTEVALKQKKRCFEAVPDDGFYFFREAGRGTWSITSDIKLVKIINEDERQSILRNMKYSEVETYRKYKAMFEKRMKRGA